MSRTAQRVSGDELRIGVHVQVFSNGGGESFINDALTPPVPEDINSFSVSALYAPRDNIDLSVSLRRQERDASSASFDSEATTLDARLSVGF